MLLIKNKFYMIFCFISCAAVAAAELCEDSAYSNICVKLGRKSYLIDGNAQLNWYEAERLCRRQNGYLATIQNGGEMSRLSDYLVSKGYLDGDQKFWLGGSDLGARSSIYSVKTGDILRYTRWSVGQPKIDAENCVALAKQNDEFLMATFNPNNKLRYICELEGNPNVSKKLIITYKYV